MARTAKKLSKKIIVSFLGLGALVVSFFLRLPEVNQNSDRFDKEIKATVSFGGASIMPSANADVPSPVPDPGSIPGTGGDGDSGGGDY